MNRNRGANSRPYPSGGASGISRGSGGKAASPQTIAALSIGAVAALGFAGWTISNALGPSTPPATPLTASAAPGTPTAAPTTPGTTAAAPSTPAPTSVGTVLEPSGGTPGRSPAASEAMLAPSADPFIALPPLAGAQTDRKAVAMTSPAPAALGNALRTVPGLKGFASPASTQSYSLVPTPHAVPSPPAVAAEIELVGTLLGNRPSAVFRTEQKMVTVPVGATFAGWKVLSVQHGEAVVWSAAGKLRLTVGTTASSGVTGPVGMVQKRQERSRNGSYSSAPAPFLSDTSGAAERAGNGVSGAADNLRNAASAEASFSPAEEAQAGSDSAALPPLPDTSLDATGRPAAPPAYRLTEEEMHPALVQASASPGVADVERNHGSLHSGTIPAALPFQASHRTAAPAAAHRQQPVLRHTVAVKHRHHRRWHRRLHGSRHLAWRLRTHHIRA
jgi:hypothetical protein